MFNLLRNSACKKLGLCLTGLPVYILWAAQFLNVAREDSLAHYFLCSVFITRVLDMVFDIWLIMACFKKIRRMFQIYLIYLMIDLPIMLITALGWMNSVILQSKIDFGKSSVLMPFIFLSITALGIVAHHVYVTFIFKKVISMLKLSDADREAKDKYTETSKEE